ncbi:MAG: hypothetical protein IIA50_04675, partial [Bacteroidetes bacterium]|nr:hypothetical protein [Bacteroidota bacterium]
MPDTGPAPDTENGRPYRRVLLKLSGEALLGSKQFGIEEDVLRVFAEEIKQISDLGTEIALVIGGGNIFRGVQNATTGMKRAHADYMGMLATMINSLALQDGLEQLGLEGREEARSDRGEIGPRIVVPRRVRLAFDPEPRHRRPVGSRQSVRKSGFDDSRLSGDAAPQFLEELAPLLDLR